MNSTTTTSTPATATATAMKKRLIKKTATEETPVEAVVAAPVVAPAPEPIAETPAPKKRGPKKATATEAPVAVPEPVATPAPAAELPTSTEVVAPAAVVAKPTVVEDIHANLARLIKIRDEASASIACLKALIVKHNREVKDARKRKNKKKTTETSEGVAEGGEGAEPAVRRPTVFTTPRKLSEGLCTFLGVPATTEIAPTEVTTRLRTYIHENNLTGTKKSEILPDAALARLMNVPVGTMLRWPDMQRVLYHDHYGFDKKTE